jgi:hypothetical protein
MKSYPHTQPPAWRPGHGHKSLKCDTCGNAIGKHDQYCVVETQVSYMRGDDEVAVYCVVCAQNAGHQVPPTKAARRLGQLKHERDAIRSKVARLNRELEAANRNLTRVEKLLAEHSAEAPS